MFVCGFLYCCCPFLCFLVRKMLPNYKNNRYYFIFSFCWSIFAGDFAGLCRIGKCFGRMCGHEFVN